MFNSSSAVRSLRVVALIALCLSLAATAEAQRRRSVRSPAAAAGQCHSFDFVRAGLKATYVTTAPSGTANYTITYISDDASRTKTTQVVTTAQGTSDVETVIDTEVVGALRAIRHINVKASQTVAVLGKITTEVDLAFVPSLVAGPADGWCVGYTWDVPPVTETIVVKTPGSTPPPQMVTTLAASGEVLAVGEVVTVPAGTFETVKYRGAIVSGTSVQTAITWMSMTDNIVVRQDSIDGSGAVVSTTTLTALQ